MIDLLELWHDSAPSTKLWISLAVMALLILFGALNRKWNLVPMWTTLIALCLGIIGLLVYSIYRWDIERDYNGLASMVLAPIVAVYLVVLIWLLASVFEKRMET